MLPPFISLTIFTTSSIFAFDLDFKNSIKIAIESQRLRIKIVENAVNTYCTVYFGARRKFVSLRMKQLNFPAYDFRFRASGEKTAVFDEIRRKFIILTPEEWVRQHVVRFLLEEKKYPKSLINVEKLLKINGRVKRYDIVVFNPDGSIFILVECKAPEIKIAQTTFDQIARYNMTMQSEFLMVTNGQNHYFCKMDYENERYAFLSEIPDYTPSGIVA